MWIKTVPVPDDVLNRSRAGYPQVYSIPVEPRPDGKLADIVSSHSLIPAALEHAFGTLAAIYAPELPLTRPQQEMIATVVSVRNRCVY